MAVTEIQAPIARSSDKPFVASTSWLAGLGATVGLGGLLASSCCVVPMALAGLGAGGAAFSGLDFLATWRIYLIAGAALALAIAFLCMGPFNRADAFEVRSLMTQLQSTITCPQCGHHALETMPTDACQFFYDCKGCGARLKPKSGDCCVFCSYGSVPCPPIQAVRSGEPGAASCCA